jgi:flagellin-like protein
MTRTTCGFPHLLHPDKKSKLNNKGISSIIATLLLIVLTIVLVAIVWTVVNGLVSDKIKQSSACFGNFETVNLNDQYTCYNTSSTPKSVQFSITVGDVNLDGVIISITGSGQSKSITLNKTAQQITDLAYYNGTNTVSMPPRNSGMTYVYNWTYGTPGSIQVAPISNGQSCASTSSITLIDSCALLS